MYAMLGTRPDISYAVTTLSKFSSNPGSAHWEAVKRVYRYLTGTRKLWLTFGGIEKELVGYADADGSMNEDRHTLSGYVFLVDGGAVSWSTKRQEIVLLSTTESEYVAATHATKEALWLRSLIIQSVHPVPPTFFLEVSHNQLIPFWSHQSLVLLTCSLSPEGVSASPHGVLNIGSELEEDLGDDDDDDDDGVLEDGLVDTGLNLMHTFNEHLDDDISLIRNFLDGLEYQ